MNIAEILKYCPKGTKLYSNIFGEVTLDKIDINEKFPIIVHKFDGMIISFTEEGCYVSYPDSECAIFPSKDQRDWSKFRLPVKKGDIMMSDNRAFIISDEYADAFNNAFHKYICGIDTTGTFKVSQLDTYWTSKFYIPASEEAKKELFDKMAEAGYRWNTATLKLEKIEFKFKEGDVVIDNLGNLCLVSKVENNNFVVVSTVLYTNGLLVVYYNGGDVKRDIMATTLTSIEDRNKFFSALVREGYKYDKEQHLLIKQEFKPFDKVLARDNETESWKADIYLKYLNDTCCYKCTRTNYAICIPYEGNEYLLDTTDSPM